MRGIIGNSLVVMKLLGVKQQTHECLLSDLGVGPEIFFFLICLDVTARCERNHYGASPIFFLVVMLGTQLHSFVAQNLNKIYKYRKS